MSGCFSKSIPKSSFKVLVVVMIESSSLNFKRCGRLKKINFYVNITSDYKLYRKDYLILMPRQLSGTKGRLSPFLKSS